MGASPRAAAKALQVHPYEEARPTIRKRWLTLVLASIIISGVLTTAVAYASSQPLAPISGFTKLSFDDEFSGHTLNTTVWAPAWFNNENVQNGTRMLRSDVSIGRHVESGPA